MDHSSSLCSRASLHWCANKNALADVSSIVPGLTVEQPLFTDLSLERVCMKMWCSLNRNPANGWRESCALWSSLPVACDTKIFLGKLLGSFLPKRMLKKKYHLQPA
jgi:hypothetical protein